MRIFEATEKGRTWSNDAYFPEKATDLTNGLAKYHSSKIVEIDWSISHYHSDHVHTLYNNRAARAGDYAYGTDTIRRYSAFRT